MQSFHEQIIAAAVDQDQVALRRVLSLSSIDVLDGNWLSPAGLLSSIGDIASAEFLITNDASINYAVSGAALGGHQAYAEALIGRGASINWGVFAGRYEISRGMPITLCQTRLRPPDPVNSFQARQSIYLIENIRFIAFSLVYRTLHSISMMDLKLIPIC
jgi:hypothetical protein